MKQLALLLALSGVAATAGLALSAAPADARLRAGLGDQKVDTFADRNFRRLHVKRTRYIVPWNAINRAAERAQVDRWMRAARQRRMEIMVAFNLASNQRCPARPCRAPSTRSYSRAVRKFHRRYRRYGVKIYQPWNESNSRTQPTSGRRGAKRVAAYYKVLRRMCRSRSKRRRCTVTGADIQDIGRFDRYAKDFLRYAGRRNRPRIMGLHNYSDTNRRGYRRTRRYIRALPRGTRVWLTETGGLYSFVTGTGKVSLRPSQSRQARAVNHAFRIARRYRRSIDRIYLYNWRALSTDRFDAGLVDPQGKPRRAYRVVRKRSIRRYFR